MEVSICEKFNEKWKEYLSEGYYGMDIESQEVSAYLDREFKHRLTKLNGFKFQQIKLKHGRARFYFWVDEDEDIDTFELELEIENNINHIIKTHNIV